MTTPRSLNEFAAIAEADGDEEPPPAGVVPREWLDARCVGTATLGGNCVDLGHHESLAELHRILAARMVHHGIPMTVPGRSDGLGRHGRLIRMAAGVVLVIGGLAILMITT